ncbi:DNA polymerase III subunit chi [Croceicoccus naphthovorans]|uniref:DNA polymerase III subunit chi n=1 Tax=Croceicoccus naphthovorans TaxID=1348774 RepID=A0A0G3XCA8_9SPHN|nr:DNA polymerase III subunit chi [Croceicoccus naphthovorans]AKM09180.1 DNA polymerase III subunit chi [Croceicoccus naphthovorans]MBB3990448.1 DNA polymerase-3 subunit chi [Croceicoccus naphthovorans]
MRVDFYHLTDDPVPAALARIAAKALGTGGRMMVVSDDAQQRGALSDALWAAVGFLANGAVDEHGAAAQPVLIGESAAPAANDAAFVALADGRWRDEALEYSRTFYFFDAATIDGARAAWRALGERDGVARHYWKQVGGRWVEGP